MKLLSVNADAKTIKGTKQGFLTGILYLAPHRVSGYNMCSGASLGCSSACLYTAGRGKMSNVQQARIRKTRYFMEQRALFMHDLRMDIQRLVYKAQRKGMLPVVRLNGTSDYPWENTGIMDEFPDVQFYDYTKILKRAYKYGRGDMPYNYHLTFSRSESNMTDCWMALSNGCNVSFVFDKVPTNYVWNARNAWDHVPVTYKVIDGDQDDLRFLDPDGVIVGLKAKGQARKDTSGFVLQEK